MADNEEKTRKLGLKELRVTEWLPPDHYVAVNKTEIDHCPTCGSQNWMTFIKNHDRKLKDILERDSNQIIHLTHRHRHANCTNPKHSSIVVETPISFAEKHSRYTCRLVRYIHASCMLHSFSETQRLLHGKLSRAEVESAFSEMTKQLDTIRSKLWNAATRIGIHIISIRGTRAMLACDLDHLSLIEVFPDTTTESVQRITDVPNQVSEVWIAMDMVLMQSVKKAFPNAVIRVGAGEVRQFLIRQVECLSTDLPNTIQRNLLRDRQTMSKPTLQKLDAALDGSSPLLREVYHYIWNLNYDHDVLFLEEFLKELQEPREDSVSEDERLFRETCDTFFHIIQDSVWKVMVGDGGREVDSEYHDRLSNISSLLNETPKCSFPHMRARIVYSESFFALQDLDNRGRRDLALRSGMTENQMFCDQIIGRSFGIYGRNLTFGQPLEDVESRLRRLSEIRKEAKADVK